jgi:hypothetical protein
MTYPCTLHERPGGWTARHDSALGQIEVSAPSREAAVEKMKNELRYRLELCPCTGEQFQHLNVEVTVMPAGK